MFIPPGNKKRYSVWPDTSGLCGLLHDTGDVLNEDPSWGIFVVDALVICVGDSAGAVGENTEVGAHAGVDHADVWGDEGDLFEGGGVD